MCQNSTFIYNILSMIQFINTLNNEPYLRLKAEYEDALKNITRPGDKK